MRRFAASDYDYNISPVTGGDITDEHIQKIIDPLLNVADFLQDNSLQQNHSGADVIVDQAERFVDVLSRIDEQGDSQRVSRIMHWSLCGFLRIWLSGLLRMQ